MRKPSHKSSGGNLLLVSCEHAGNRIPAEYAHLFRGARAVLASHRGWDPGALEVARTLTRRFQRPLYVVTWSRLLVEANRSVSNPRIWSDYTRDLPADQRQRILDRYWRPHRQEVEQAVWEGVARDCRVVHVAVHSFTPVLSGEVRTADIGLLYDPARTGERTFCRRWEESLCQVAPAFRVRRNYPYRGTADGLTTWLRRRFADRSYLGIELELNQNLLAGPGRDHVETALETTLGQLLTKRG